VRAEIMKLQQFDIKLLMDLKFINRKFINRIP